MKDAFAPETQHAVEEDTPINMVCTGVYGNIALIDASQAVSQI